MVDIYVQKWGEQWIVKQLADQSDLKYFWKLERIYKHQPSYIIFLSQKIECPWEIAISEIRLCYILLAILGTLTGMYALKKTNKKYAELSFQISLAFSALLVIDKILKIVYISILWLCINKNFLN